MKQSQAVLQATQEVLKQRGIDFAPTVTDARAVVDSDARKAIIDSIVTLFESGQVEFKDTPSNNAKLQDAKLLRNYVNGLVTNWFNKSKDLNGGTTHKSSPKKKSDAQLKELHILKKEAQGHSIDPENLALIEQAIAEREAELAM
jgi:hypothetical protein